jgi:hypothetical protein
LHHNSFSPIKDGGKRRRGKLGGGKKSLDGSRKTLHGTRNGFFFLNSKLREKKK